jgi:hypothetical protein
MPVDVLGHAADVWGSRAVGFKPVRHGDSLSLWKYAIQAGSQEMTGRPAGKAVGNAGLCR